MSDPASTGPVVTVVVPARNEAADIEGCLAHIAAQDYPHDRMEVVVVDGGSTDATSVQARAALEGTDYHHSAVLLNREATTPSNLNTGLRYATGQIIVRVDARTRIEPHYVRTCVTTLRERPEVAVVGGAQIALARDGSWRAVGIARALNNRYSMGGSPYRRATGSGPSDTVYLGAFRRADLLEVHGWDERMLSNQDFDLNRRMSERGSVWFDASLRSGYIPRSGYRDLWRQYVRFGQAKVRYWRMSGDRPQPRQRVLLALPVVGVCILALAGIRGRTLPLAALGAAGLVGIERVGTSPQRSRASAHVGGVLAMLCVGGGWTVGAWREALRR